MKKVKEKSKNYNLTYCSNIFKNKKFEELIYNIRLYIKTIKNKNISICLSKNLIKDIKKNIDKSKTFLKTNKIKLILINGFVYKNFHQKKIKEKIYYPDWTKENRVNFTKDLIFYIQKISKKKHTNGISTMPISYKEWIQKEKKYNIYKSILNIYRIFKILIKIKKYKNININIDIEPEPFCLLENSKDFVEIFKYWILPVFKKKYKYELKENISISKIKNHIKLCYDICHFSVNFQNHKKNLNEIRKDKIKIGRVQVSSCIKINKISNEKIDKLKFLKRSPFLHQTTYKFNNSNGKKNDFKKIKKKTFSKIKELRIHCHVPINKRYIFKNILTTQNEIKNTIKYIIKNNLTNNFEIETYTYDTIYKKEKKEIISKEYTWLKNLIEKLK